MLLIAAVVALFIGPLLFQAARAGSHALAFLEGFTFITIAGLLLFNILPPAIAAGGAGAWVFAAIGLIFPVALEQLFHRLAREVHMLILLVGIAGLGVHAALDGIALALPEAAASLHGDSGHGGENDIALAVVLHRFPIGLAVWYLLAPAAGRRVALGALMLMAAGTAIGYAAGDSLLELVQGRSVAWFQAFVAGSILHVIVYEPGHHAHGHGTHSPRLSKWPDRMGLTCGLVLLFFYL